AGIGEVLKDLKKAQVVNFDLGIGDPVTPAPKNVVTPTMLETNEEISWSVYPIETICAEKLHALISHGDLNSRSKNIHDLAIFLPNADSKTLKEAIKKSFAFRETDVPPSFLNVLKKLDTTSLERGWANAVASVKDASSFMIAFQNLLDQVSKLEK
ncbi:MAG: nucleotidyl transferase AbiEii/AbiGii toxin family protein, partial [Pseudobdellovibrionaceae bacterium]